MGWSIQTLSGRDQGFNDADLIAVICLMKEVIEAGAHEFPNVRPAVQEWHARLRGYGPGTIDLSLDEHVSSAVVAEELVQLCSSVLGLSTSDRLNAILQLQCNTRGVKYTDEYDPARVAEAVARLTALLTPVDPVRDR